MKRKSKSSSKSPEIWQGYDKAVKTLKPELPDESLIIWFLVERFHAVNNKAVIIDAALLFLCQSNFLNFYNEVQPKSWMGVEIFEDYAASFIRYSNMRKLYTRLYDELEIKELKEQCLMTMRTKNLI